MIAIGSGGFFGVGLGESVQKIFYLPEAHTDMILAIIGEELGLVGIIGVVALYGHDRLRGAARGQARARPLLAAARRRHHLADPLPGDAQLLRGDGHGAAHRRAAAVHLLRQLQPDRADRRDGPAAQRRRHRRQAGARAKPRLQAIEGGRDADGRDRGRRDGRARRAGARGRRRAEGSRRGSRVRGRRARRGGARAGGRATRSTAYASRGHRPPQPAARRRAPLVLALRATPDGARRLLRAAAPTWCWAAAATWPGRSGSRPARCGCRSR